MRPQRVKRPFGSAWLAACAALAMLALLFGLRFVPSLSPHILAASPELSVPYRYISVGWLDWATVQLKEIAAAQDPGQEVLFVLGLAHEALGEHDAAIAVYDRIARTFADDAAAVARAKALAGHAHLALGRSGAAKELLLDADRLAPGQALVTYGLGVIAAGEGDVEGALRWFAKAREASPQWVLPAVWEADLYIQSGDPAGAVALLRPYEAVASREVDYHLKLAAAYALLARKADDIGLASEEYDALGLIGAEDPVEVLVALARHGIDRAQQLDPGRTELLDLSRLVDELSPP